MMAKIFPSDALRSAFIRGISFCRATKKATSEEKGKMVAAKKAEKKSAISAILYSLLRLL